MNDAADGAIDSAAFAAAMARCEPFEPSPRIAVGVSGGPDSMALVLLVDEWARAREGAAIGFTVDHGLRPGSGPEALQVGAWLARRGVAHAVLPWHGDKPSTGLQKAARDARYGLLSEVCRTRGILHLAVAHHQGDQAETVLFRRERGSGADGLAGMSASRSLGAVRLIRPLLDRRKAALIATCVERRQPFIDDPSNHAARFARTALRRRLGAEPELRDAVLSHAAEMARARAAAERASWGLLARAVEIGPDGAARIDRLAFAERPAGERVTLLAATLRTVGGRAFAPNSDAVARLDLALADDGFRGASLGGCAIRPRDGSVLVCRELRGIAAPVPIIAGQWILWDHRFAARVDRPGGNMVIGALGKRDLSWLRGTALRETASAGLPVAVGAALPALRSGPDLVAVPSLGWAIAGAPALALRFAPRWPLSSEAFTVVNRSRDIIFDIGA